MRKLISALFAASVAFAAPVFAQDAAETQSIVLKVDAGSILTSTGDEFVTAHSGQQVVVGEKLLVNTGSSLRVVYDRGNTDPKDDCVIELKKPGVYPVPEECKGAVAWMVSNQTGNVAIIVGAGLVGAALIASLDGNPTPANQFSLGSR